MMENRYDLVVFDVDGTLLDTTQGVLAGVKYTIEKMGYPELKEEQMKSFIGPPIQDSFARMYGLQGPVLQELATIFRDRYSQVDLLKAVPYDGIYKVFEKIQERGMKSAIATYKREDYAITLLKHFSFDRYTSVMYGADHENKRKKKDIIQICMEALKIKNPKRAVMVGDTIHDALGAQELGMDFIGVTYGFGFGKEEDMALAKAVGWADKPEDLLLYL